MPEYKVQEVKKSKYVIAHYGIFKIGWDWLILLCTFYTAIMVPYNAAFTDMENDNSKSSLYSDIVVEIMFIIGMWICERMCIHVPPKFVVLFYQTILIKDYSNNSIFHTSSENVIKIALKLQNSTILLVQSMNLLKIKYSVPEKKRLYFSDIALNFRTSFIDKSGHVVYDGRLIVTHYVKGWFPLDLLAAIPFDLMFLFNRFYKLNTVSLF